LSSGGSFRERAGVASSRSGSSDQSIGAGAVQDIQQVFEYPRDVRSFLRDVEPPKTRATMRLSISWRVLVVSISSWMEMSAVEKVMELKGERARDCLKSSR
jgi:hypothetical protein